MISVYFAACLCAMLCFQLAGEAFERMTEGRKWPALSKIGTAVIAGYITYDLVQIAGTL